MKAAEAQPGSGAGQGQSEPAVALQEGYWVSTDFPCCPRGRTAHSGGARMSDLHRAQNHSFESSNDFIVPLPNKIFGFQR